MKRTAAILMTILLLVSGAEEVWAREEPEVSAPSAVVMEPETGQIIYEKNGEAKLPPASVTKVMTMLLIFDALEEEAIELEDEVTVSEHAASMGGSQVFLEPGETQTVETMLKCIAVASANDASVAMAEYIAGDEGAFVERMNERAKTLGMEDTRFVNCCGLDAEGHETTALDIAKMTRELTTKHKQVFDYTSIWMDTITHQTKKGTSEFGLSNTNKLMRQYEYATGLKTGSTSKAKFCLSATATKQDVDMIAVVMAADSSKDRVKDAIVLLNYGFAVCTKYVDEKPLTIPPVSVRRGKEKQVEGRANTPFAYVDTKGRNLAEIKRKVELKGEVEAPVKKGQKIGTVVYTIGTEEIGRVPVLAAEEVGRMTYQNAFFDAVSTFLL